MPFVRLTIVASLLVLACLGSALASKLPFYDVKAWCNRVAESGGARSEVIFQGCFEQEQAAYDKLKSKWDALSGSVQSWCDRVASSGGSGSFQILGGCIEQEMQARDQNKGREFRR